MRSTMVTIMMAALSSCAAPSPGGGAGKQTSATSGSSPTASIAPPGGTSSTSGPADACTGQSDCIDVDTLPIQWTTGRTAVLFRVPDMTGDGVPEIAVGNSIEVAYTAVLTAGPYAVPRADLSDAVATYGGWLQTVGDQTGDGIIDFLRTPPTSAEEYVSYDLVAGPLVGDVSAAPVVALVDASRGIHSGAVDGFGVVHGDTTGDGIADLTLRSEGSYVAGATEWGELYPGPLSGWTSSAALRVEHVLDPDEPEDCLYVQHPDAFQACDLDGDGTPEQIIGDGLPYEDCVQNQGYVLPPGYTGTVTISRAAPPAFALYNNGHLVPDQDGDGIQDTFYVPKAPDTDPGVGYGLYSGPMAEIDGMWRPSGPRILDLGDGEPLLYEGSWEPLWDVDGDGITDWLVRKAHMDGNRGIGGNDDFIVYRGGVDALAALEQLGRWATLYSSHTYLVIPEEQALLIASENGFAVVDLSTL